MSPNPDIVIVDSSDPTGSTVTRRAMTDEEYADFLKQQADAKKNEDDIRTADVTRKQAMRQAVLDYKNATSIAGVKTALIQFLRLKGDLTDLE